MAYRDGTHFIGSSNNVADVLVYSGTGARGHGLPPEITKLPIRSSASGRSVQCGCSWGARRLVGPVARLAWSSNRSAYLVWPRRQQ